MARGGLAGLASASSWAASAAGWLTRAALVEPDAAGLRTENGNVIGTITFDGTLALLVFGGLLARAIIGSLWVVIRPWLPQRPLLRALVAMPICVAMGTTILVQDTNRTSHPVATSPSSRTGATRAGAVDVAESALDRLLPVARRRGPALVAYALIDAFGAFLVLALVVPLYLLSPLVVAGIAFVVVGIGSIVERRPQAVAAPVMPRPRCAPSPVRRSPPTGAAEGGFRCLRRPKQCKFMGAELQRKREGKQTKTDMSEAELEKMASKPDKKG